MNRPSYLGYWLVLAIGFLVSCSSGQATINPSAGQESTQTVNIPTEEISPVKVEELAKTTNINIDGDAADWQDYEEIFSDPQGDNERNSFDISTIKSFRNNKFLYILIETYKDLSDYEQIDVGISAGERSYIVSFTPKNFNGGYMGETTNDEWKDIGELKDSASAQKDAIEIKIPLSVFNNTDDILFQIIAMGGECCDYPNWYAIDSTKVLLPTPTEEIEQTEDLTLPKSNPGQAFTVEQKAIDLTRFRCDEPGDIVTNSDRSIAYVVCRNVDVLFVIDTNNDQITDVLPINQAAEHPFGAAPGQIAITPDDTILLATNEMDSSLTFIDAANLKILNTAKLDMSPQRIAVASNGNFAYVVGHESGQLTVIDLKDRTISQKIPLPGLIAPYSVVTSPDSKLVYVAAIQGGIYKIDTETNKPLVSMNLPEAGWRGDMIITKDGSTIYLASVASDWIAEIDTQSMQVTRQLNVFKPQALLLSENEENLYVGIFNSFTELTPLIVINLESGEIINEITIKSPAPHVSWTADIEGLAYIGDGSRIYAPCIDADGIFVIDEKTQRESAFIPLTAFATLQPEHLVIDSSGSTLYTVNAAPQAPSISVIDVSTENVNNYYYLQEDACFGQASSLSLTPDDLSLYVSTPKCLLVFDTASQSFIESFPIVLPNDNEIRDLVIAPDGKNIYIIDSGGVFSTVDITSHQVISSLPAITDGYNIKVSPDGKRVYVTGSTEYAAIDPMNNKLLASEEINVTGDEQLNAYADRAIGIPPEHDFYTIGDFYYMQVYDTDTNQLARSIDLEPWAPGRTLVTDVIFSPDGKTGYLALWDLKGITVFDSSTWQLKAQIDTGLDPVYGICPDDFAISPNGDKLYVTGEQSDNIMVIDTVTNEIISVISLVP